MSPELTSYVLQRATSLGLTALGALVVWIVGRIVIKLAVRPYCHNDRHWQVYFDMNRLIVDSFGEAGYPAPSQQIIVRSLGTPAGV